MLFLIVAWGVLENSYPALWLILKYEVGGGGKLHKRQLGNVVAANLLGMS